MDSTELINQHLSVFGYLLITSVIIAAFIWTLSPSKNEE